MCEHGDSVDMEVIISAFDSHTGATRVAVKPIDRCIAPIVAALNAAGIFTRGCCCGHGAEPGTIILHDGRVLTIGMWDSQK